jgi:hypothetical protein
MRRRIERSRARCEKAATTNRRDKVREPDERAKLGGVTSVESAEKGG